MLVTRNALRSALVGSLLLLQACGGPTEPIPVVTGDLSTEWPTGSPVSQDLDPGGVANAVAHARSLPRPALPARGPQWGPGRRGVFQRQFSGQPERWASVTKSVLSTLVGTALHQGKVPSLEARLDAFLAPSYIGPLGPDKRAIRFGDLLTMSGGFEWHENDGVLPPNAEYNGWILSPDPVAYLLARRLAFQPGSTFTYNTAGTHLLSVMLAGALDQPLTDFARTEVFDPLGIDRARWETFPDGTPNGGSGIKLRPRDFAKIGGLWLQGGDTGQETLLDLDYVDAGTTPRFNFVGAPQPLTGYGYGYSWWIARTPYGDGFFAWGFGGRFVFVVPARSLVVVVTTEWRNAGALAGQLEFNGLDLIVNHILPAVRR